MNERRGGKPSADQRAELARRQSTLQASDANILFKLHVKRNGLAGPISGIIPTGAVNPIHTDRDGTPQVYDAKNHPHFAQAAADNAAKREARFRELRGNS